MYPGMIIQYTVQPVAGIPLNWVTEITQVKEYEYFIDEQRFGPYSFWHHQHHFEENNKGVLMTDILHYGIPFGPMGKLADRFFVGKKVEEIFSYREQKLDVLFPKRK
jgi:ligand-binding SRPBCC domain-containing protein